MTGGPHGARSGTMGSAGAGLRVEVVTGAPDAATVRAVRALDAAATAVDGASAYSEATRLALRSDLPAATHLLVHAGVDDAPAGYAHLAADCTAELAVHPDRRRAGHGGALLGALQSAAGDRLRVWSYLGHPGAAALAATHGLAPVRELLRMRRPLPLDAVHDPPGPVPLPPGVTVRTFDPARDAEPWLALNARAFTGHGEQGGLTRPDLDARMATSWFDPAGFFLAERVPPARNEPGGPAGTRTALRAGRLVGFHWTKRHPADPVTGTPAAGEIYVLGVDPDEHGGGLGRALSRIGLRHLAEAGLPSAVLYVDADNAAAVAVYTRLGFDTEWSAVTYGHPGTRGH